MSKETEKPTDEKKISDDTLIELLNDANQFAHDVAGDSVVPVRTRARAHAFITVLKESGRKLAPHSTNAADGGNIALVGGDLAMKLVGDINIAGGKPRDSRGSAGSIILQSPEGDREFLRIDPDGAIFIRGEAVDDNKVVYASFLAWLATCMQLPRQQQAQPQMPLPQGPRKLPVPAPSQR